MSNSNGEPRKRGRKPKVRVEDMPPVSKPDRLFSFLSVVGEDSGSGSASSTSLPVTSSSSNLGGPVLVHLQVPVLNFQNEKSITQVIYDTALSEPSPWTTEGQGSFAPFSTVQSQQDGGLLCFNENEQHSTSNTQDETPKSTFEELKSFSKGYPFVTNICCWWCSHPFTNRPVGIPRKYIASTNEYMCQGCFCSFPCALAYARAHHVSCHLLHQMYYQWTGQTCLKSAPPKSMLNIFGGPLNIIDFRLLSEEGKEYRDFTHPQIPWPMIKSEVQPKIQVSQPCISSNSVVSSSSTSSSPLASFVQNVTRNETFVSSTRQQLGMS